MGQLLYYYYILSKLIYFARKGFGYICGKPRIYAALAVKYIKQAYIFRSFVVYLQKKKG